MLPSVRPSAHQRTEKDRKGQERQKHERKVLETCRKGIQDRICPSYGVLGGRGTIWIAIIYAEVLYDDFLF